MTEVALEPVPALSKALLALPLGLIAVFAWWDWVLMPAMLIGVLIVFGFRQNPRTNRYAAYSSIYAAALVFAVPPWVGFWFLERLQMFFVALLLAHLIGLAFDGARHGSFWAWLAPSLVFVIHPSAMGLFVALGFGMLGALERRQQRLGDWSQSRPGLIVLVSLGLLGALVLLPLPRPGTRLENREVQQAVQIVEPQQTSREESKPVGPIKPAPVKAAPNTQPPTPPNVLEVFGRSFTVINLAMLTVLVCLTILTLRYRSSSRGEVSRWEDSLPLVAATILGLMVLLYGASAPAGGSGIKGQNAEQQSGLQRSSTNQDPNSLSAAETASRPAESPWPTVILAVLTMASIAWVMLRNSGRFVRLELRPTEDREVLEPEAATNRVREAYRAFLALCSRNGLVRLESETPLEFAQRLGQRQALALEPASALTRLYEPVRYGGVSDSAGARAAERALVALRTILQPLDSRPLDVQQRKGNP
jgi:Domain of unknown function (DUF4129)